MQDYKKEFIKFAIDNQVLRFGRFTLKSGRISPYFFNSGLFNTGAQLAKLSQFYARAIHDQTARLGLSFDTLFGPAYKGIPLVAGISMALYQGYGQDYPYAFNRKEAKDHGEGGSLVGAELKGRVLVVDDVISAGTSVRESVKIIQDNHAEFAGVAIALDRKERGLGASSAIGEIEKEYGVSVLNIIDIQDIIDFLDDTGQGDLVEKMLTYRQQYGVSGEDDVHSNIRI
ncbi:MAG: orotate phosphoribosyltransferase [Gammaproteobacteria bacterium]|nr:MAG: orotate phosphoribosyltransferase [Gammaproteobacteria bacterium]